MIDHNRPRVFQIFTASGAGERMQRRPRVTVVAGEGIVDDRYALGTGAFSKGKRQVIRQVSLVALEAIHDANEGREVPFTDADTRRNIVTRGINLNELVDTEFLVGNVLLRGVELCDPCGRPSKLIGNSGFKEAFENRGGLRAEALSSGVIAVNHDIQVQPS